MKAKKRVISSLLIAVISVFMLAETVSAGTRVLPVKKVVQAKSNWCWAAASEMVGAYGVTTSLGQADVVALIHGNTLPNLGGSVNNMVSGVQYVSNYTKQAYSSGFVSLASATAQINNSHPFIIRVAWDNGGGHAVVCAGYSDASLYIVDPEQSNATRYYSYTTFANGGAIGHQTGHASHAFLY